MKKLVLLFILVSATCLYSQFPDTSYGVSSIADIPVNGVQNNFYGMNAAFQSTGKILVVSATVSNTPDHTFHITRLTTSGQIDNTFGIDGVSSLQNSQAISQPHQILVLPDDKFLAVGSMYRGGNYYPVVIRFLENGFIDASFGANGVVELNFPGRVAKAIRHSGDGNLFILIRGDTLKASYLTKISLDGNTISTFGNNGSVLLPEFGRVYEMAVQSNGRILVTGELTYSNVFAVLGISPSGQIDNSFGTGDGWFRRYFNYNSAAVDITLHSDKIYLGGVVNNIYYTIQALTADGLNDVTFGNAGLASVYTAGQTNAAYTVLVLSDGKLLLTGYGKNFPSGGNFSDMLMVRFHENGILDVEFGANGYWYSNTSYHDGLRHTIVDESGDIYAIGYRRLGQFVRPAVVKLFQIIKPSVQISAESIWFDSDFDGYASGILEAVTNPADTVLSYSWIVNGEIVSEEQTTELTLSSGERSVLLETVFSTGDTIVKSKNITVLAVSKNLNIPVEGALSSINNYFVFPSLNKNMYIVDSLGTIKYLYETGGAIKSTPAVSDQNNIYTGTNDTRIYSFDIFLNSHWDKAMGGQIETTPGLSANGEVLYTGTMNGLLKAIKCVDGSPLWTISTGGSLKSSPVVVENNSGNQIIYFIVSYTNPARAKLFAIEDLGNTYQELWNMDIASEVVSTPALINSNENTFIYFGDLAGNIYRVRWDGYFETDWVKNLGSPVYASPVSGVDDLIYFASYNGKLMGFELEFTTSSEPAYQFNSGENIKATPSIGNAGIIYIATNSGRIIALKKDEGNTELILEWQLKIAGAMFKGHTIITSNDVLILIDENGKYIAVKEYNQPAIMNAQANKWGTYKGNAKRSKVVSNLLTGIEGEENIIVKEYKLEQNYPNPFNPSTQIKFTLSKESRVKLSIYNVSGEVVRVLIDENRSSGNYSISFDGSNLSSGVYICLLYTSDAADDG
ncbi:MAG: PQQ-binding-like beta-propeller repeat protein, partial [Ignavibacteriaceae bacterium]|nr:PQQ-binding-like beta-propeller repeat protein [Ignavibacteriaceae bacterium]